MEGKTGILFMLLTISIVSVSGCTTGSGPGFQPPDLPQPPGTDITSFEECVAAGNPVMESYPRRCRTDDGRTYTEEMGEPIGGQRDDKGCLGPAGYSWSEEAGACIRTWELDPDQKEAAWMAVEHLGWKYATTIVEVIRQKCPGCYLVRIEQGEDRASSEVQISNWTVADDS